MTLNIDSFIFLSFIVINMVVGLFFSRGIKNIKEYSVGTGNFSATTIAATLVATWISGGTFMNVLRESYDHGLYFIWAVVGNGLVFLLVGYVYAPRMGEFIGKLSIADAMGSLYGDKVKFVTAVAGCLGSAGLIAIQLKVAGELLQYSFNIPSFYGVIISGILIGTYASLGGIRSVTFTDVIQLFTFGAIVPTLAFFVFASLESSDLLYNNLKNSSLFNIGEIFDFSQAKSFEYLLFFIYCLIPEFSPSIFQRILMAKNTLQIRRSFIIGSITCLGITFIMCFIGVLVLAAKPGMPSKEVFNYLLSNYSYPGLRGLTLIGIMAMVMSTADSNINTTAVLVVHDIGKSIGMGKISSELTRTRIASFVITLLALTLTNLHENLLQLTIAIMGFYMPVVTVPITMAIFGFRTSSRAVLIAMAAGLFATIIFKTTEYSSIFALLSSMLINLIFLIGSHYLLKESGGWIGIKDVASFNSYKQQRNAKFKYFIKNIRAFSLVNFFRVNSTTQETTYVSVSIFSLIAAYMSIFSLDKSVATQYKNLIDIVYPSMLFAITALLSYPLWPERYKKSLIHAYIWNIVIFYNFVCCSFLFVILSKFASIQIAVFMINLIIISILLRWQMFLLMNLFGIVFVVIFLQIYTDQFSLNNINLEFSVGYLLLALCAILVIFLKQRQEYIDLNLVRQELLDEQMRDKDDELSRLLKIKSEFLQNINQQIRSSIVGITSIGKNLYQKYQNQSQEQFRDDIKQIADNSVQLEELVHHILDMSSLASLNYKLDLKLVNLSDLVYKRINTCKKLYLIDKELDFITDIENAIYISCDEHYIRSTIDTLLINSIKYSQGAKIYISLKKNENSVKFIITDECIDFNIENISEVSIAPPIDSSLPAPLSERGVGIALCKKAIQAHGGDISSKTTFIKDKNIIQNSFCFHLPIT